ncbi:MAG: hypothetical protein QMC40_08460, partial [Vicingaceae bacterium]
MKKIAVYSFTLTLLAFTACNQDKIDQLNKEKSELTTLSSSQEQSIESMLASFNQIQENLNEIKTREGIIR